MEIQLDAQIEDNRWIVLILSGEYKNRLGDFRIFGRDNLESGQKFVVKEELYFPPTLAHYNGKLTIIDSFH
jgi:hypothetical protein